jgi:hypothetical protein
LASADKEQLGADLSAYLDGELSPRRAREIERLLKESEGARRLLAELRAVSQDLRDLPRMRAPESLADAVRRANERQVAEPRRAPAGRMRVVRLFTRVAASAAVIAVCMFAGWMLHERLAPPPARPTIAQEARAPKGRARDAVARRALSREGVPADVAAAKPPAVAMAELKSLGYVGADQNEDGKLGPSAEPQPPADKVLVAAMPPAPKTGETALTLDVAAPATDMPPTLNVVVTPRDAEQFDAALQLVAAWQQQPPVVGERMAKGVDGAVGSGRGRGAAPFADARRAGAFAALAQQEFVVEVPPTRVSEVLQALERQAPRQVQVAMTFSPADLPQVEQMVARPSSAPPSEEMQTAESELAPAVASSEPETFGLEQPAGRGGGRGRVVRKPVQAKGAVPGQTEAGERREELAAEHASEALQAEARRASRDLSFIRGSERAELDEELPARAKKDTFVEKERWMPDLRSPTVAEVARPISQTIAQQAAADQPSGDRGLHGAEAAGEPPTASTSIREQARELRDRLGEVCEKMLGPASEPPSGPGPEPQRADRASVTLRVTVLPPPQSTQPASDTSSAETP